MQRHVIWTKDEEEETGKCDTHLISSVKDVENSIAQFSGNDKLSIEKWLSNFEDLSALLKQNELQKIIYCKQMLRGLAKQFIT